MIAVWFRQTYTGERIIVEMQHSHQRDFLEKFPQFQKLADIVDAQALNKEEYYKYFHSMLILNDNYSTYRITIETGEEKSLAKGRAEGMMVQGEATERIRNARAMKEKGYP